MQFLQPRIGKSWENSQLLAKHSQSQPRPRFHLVYHRDTKCNSLQIIWRSAINFYMWILVCSWNKPKIGQNNLKLSLWFIDHLSNMRGKLKQRHGLKKEEKTNHPPVGQTCPQKKWSRLSRWQRRLSSYKHSLNHAALLKSVFPLWHSHYMLKCTLLGWAVDEYCQIIYLLTLSKWQAWTTVWIGSLCRGWLTMCCSIALICKYHFWLLLMPFVFCLIDLN